MALSKDEREQFLAEPHIGALSVNAGDKRGPLTVPIWYQYSPGGEPWVHTGAGEGVVIYLKPQHWLSADLGAV
jgi:nitroimidazol reductase NimA-like FMN-containing flavoprotein (pyridoxamine 5'-phosphate oxidase superfamily)